MTLREILAQMMSVRLASLVCGAIVVCVVAGPFHTLGMPLPQRAAYWGIGVTVATGLSMVIITYAFDGARMPPLPRLARGLMGTGVFSVLYAGFHMILGWVFLADVGRMPGYLELLGYVLPIAVGITLIVYLFRREEPGAPGTPATLPETLPETLEGGDGAPAPPRILSRIKPGLGARLQRLTVQDHYVEVFTDRGSQLVLMRFSDALEEVAPIPGWRIHRSHWVAEAALADIRRAQGKTLAILADGAELPISRTYLPALRDAGVLKRFA